MEKVQFQLEATLPELKDLHEKGLFSKHEINEITRRRTSFEMSLIRRVTRKEDFFKYAEYEINLERLRRVRWKRLKYHLNPPPPSASTYSLQRRALYILKRATAKFPGDLAVWLAYVEYASREGMRKVVLKGLTSALQYHPLSPTIYLLISYNHLHPSSPLPRSAIPSTSKLDLPSSSSQDEDSGFSLEGTSPARTTLLLGLRLLPQSRDLWREYIKLELGWVEALRRRWKVLGIDNATDPSGDGAFRGNDVELIAGEGSFGPQGEDARKAILAGQLVVHAISSALEAIPTAEDTAFREELLHLLRAYPSPLRTKALEVVYSDLERIADGAWKASAEARLLVLTKRLYDRPYDPSKGDEGGVILSGVELVEEIGLIGKEIRRIAKVAKGSTWSDVAGKWLAVQLERYGDNTDLREYIFSILTSLTKPAMHPPPTLLLLHLDHLARSPASSGSIILATTRAHAALHPIHTGLQRLHMAAEVDHEPDAEVVRAAFQSVIKAVTRQGLSNAGEDDVRSIWLSRADFEESLDKEDEQGFDRVWDRILQDSLRTGASINGLHSSLLIQYLASTLRLHPPRPTTKTLERITAKYRPTATFFIMAFSTASGGPGERNLDLRKLYDVWRAVCTIGRDRVEAVLVWAGWLLAAGKGREAGSAIYVVRREVRDDGEALDQLDSGWKGLLDKSESPSNGEEEDSDTRVASRPVMDVDEADGVEVMENLDET